MDQDHSAEDEYRLAVTCASGVTVPVNLEESLRHLQAAARLGHAAAQTELATLGAKGRPAQAVVADWLRFPDPHALSMSPRIVMVMGFLPHAVCDWMMKSSGPNLKRAEIYDRKSGELRADEVRSNSAAQYLPTNLDTVFAFVRARIGALVDVPVGALETTQILHYKVGEEFGAHYDFLDLRFPGLAKDAAEHGQRAMTVLVYLNEDYAGGDTAFPVIGRSFKGKKGDSLVFWNLNEDNTPDFNTQHVGTAPTSGEKWLLSQWIRVRV